jgi:hypothetical protein
MKCPDCGSTRVYPSRLRTPLERMRQQFTDKQPYRCHHCNWRRWRDVEMHLDRGPEVTPDDLRTGHAASPLSSSELDSLDPSVPRS